MDPFSLGGVQLSPLKEFDRKVEFRAQKHEHLRGRNNATSCRSPTREFDTKLIKNELKEKRQLEFLRRRSVSPELGDVKSKARRTPPPKMFSKVSSGKAQTLHANNQEATAANGCKIMILTPNSSTGGGPAPSQWASYWSEQVALTRQERGHARKQAFTSAQASKEPSKTKGTVKAENRINAQKTNIKSVGQTENFLPKKILIEASIQTDSGLVTIKESDLQLLAVYLQEALWREEALKEKLAALQESTSDLTNSSKTVWTARCSEELLRNKIKGLEAQLQVCLQKFPKDGVKKLVLQMEKQKLLYEEKALVALQKATQEKMEALSKAEALQEALMAAKADELRWQSLYEELKMSSSQLREQQHHRVDQLQQLQSQIKLSGAREAELKEEVASLRQEKKELQYSICLLEEDNQTLREEIHNLRDGGNEDQDFLMQGFLTSQEAETQLAVRRDSQVEEQLRHTQEKLRLKEKECEELQTDLHAMEQECHSSQTRLSQCRDELRQLSHHCRTATPCVSWWKVLVFLLLLLAMAGVAMLWLWHPPFREQVEDLYSDIETRMEDYLMQMASPQHSGCFRPV
ncbi:TRAF3-interacting JNK-activating modulator [Aulostomus maculatus]